MFDLRFKKENSETSATATSTESVDATGVDGNAGSLNVGLELMYVLRGDGDVCHASIVTLANPSRFVHDSN